MLSNTMRSVLLRSTITNSKQLFATSSSILSQKIARDEQEADKRKHSDKIVKDHNKIITDSYKEAKKHIKEEDGIVYSQGQEHQDTKEYFYYIDHHGQLFLDDTKTKNFTSCYKEQKFLENFFKNLRKNTTQRFQDFFPFVSYSEDEVNFLRCEDLPFVVTHLDEHNNLVRLNQMSSAHWLFHFDPEKLYYNPKNSRLYYLFEDKEIIKSHNLAEDDPRRLKHLDKLPCKIGLIKKDLNNHLMNKTKKVTDHGGDKISFDFEYRSKIYKLNTIGSHEKPIDLLKKFSKHAKDL